MPTLALVAALAPLPLLPWPSTPTAGVSALNVRSIATCVSRELEVGADEVVRLRVDVGGEAPRGERLDPLVADAADVEAGVDHLLSARVTATTCASSLSGSHTERPTSIVPSLGRTPMRVNNPASATGQYALK